MQAPNNNEDSKQDDLEKKVEQQLELSEAWRQLLGLEALPVPLPVSSDAALESGADAQEGLPELNDDPWTRLVHEQGVQVVDLQRAHIHPAQTSGEASDVEHALDIMQENLPEK
jgi:hypothetical protein